LAALSLIYLSFFVMALVAFFAQKKDVKGHWLFGFSRSSSFRSIIWLFPDHGQSVLWAKADQGWEEIARVKETR
jgi:hypothetical protein